MVGRPCGPGNGTKHAEAPALDLRERVGAPPMKVVVFGVAPDPTMRAEVVSAVGAARSGRLVDVPDPIAGPLNAFAVVYHPDPGDPAATLIAFDEDGRLVATATVAPSPGEGTGPVAPSPGSE